MIEDSVRRDVSRGEMDTSSFIEDTHRDLKLILKQIEDKKYESQEELAKLEKRAKDLKTMIRTLALGVPIQGENLMKRMIYEATKNALQMIIINRYEIAGMVKAIQDFGIDITVFKVPFAPTFEEYSQTLTVGQGKFLLTLVKYQKFIVKHIRFKARLEEDDKLRFMEDYHWIMSDDPSYEKEKIVWRPDEDAALEEVDDFLTFENLCQERDLSPTQIRKFLKNSNEFSLDELMNRYHLLLHQVKVTGGDEDEDSE